MDKRIEDYLHLYLGCEGLYLAGYGVHGKKQVKAKFVGFTSQGKLILICYDITGKEWGYDVVADFYEFIPAIRPLSDMTEDEAIECIDYDPKIFIPFNEISKDWRTKVLDADRWRKLISKGFDLFGLIDAGLAIDKTKL